MALILSTSSEAARMLIAIWFGVCMFRMCSNSALGMFLMYDNTRRVGSRECVVHVLLWANGDMCLLPLLYGHGLYALCPWVC